MLVLDSQESMEVRAAEIEIDDDHRVPRSALAIGAGQGQAEVSRDRALADASLAGRDGQ